MKGRERFPLIFGLTLGILIGLAGASRTGLGVMAQDDSADSSTPARAEDVVEAVGSAVVTVLNEQRFEDGSGTEIQPVGSGTGFIIDDEGHIVTNWHVVEGGEQFEVILADGTILPAELVGSDKLSDLAVVRVEGDLPGIVPLGDSDLLKPGQPVLAIGSALGAFTNTVTQGIVSAIGRDFPGSQTYTNLIQHDAAINPGNSGGPLFNFDGEVVGVNTLGIPISETGEIVQGLFFSIPSNTVKKITADLIENGEVVYPYFGIEFASVTPDIVAEFDLPVQSGVIVIGVTEDGPAAKAGVQIQDVVIEIGGTRLDAQTSFSEALFEHKPGETVEVKIIRDGEEISLEVTFAERPDGLN